MQYLFILGSTPELSLKEIESEINSKSMQRLAPNVIQVTSEENLDTDYLIKHLGGTVKIAVVEKPHSDKNYLLGDVVDLLSKETSDKIIFGTSVYGNFFLGNLKTFNKQIKDSLEEKGKKVRFVIGDNAEISSVQITKMRVTDIALVKIENRIVIAKTINVQDFEDWGNRDYKRPASDPKSGMLPPKVARMMINIAIDNKNRLKNNDKNPLILDPFCGVGTVGMEGLMVGSWVVMSDILKEQVNKTQKNLDWLSSSYGFSPENYKVIESDARNIASLLPEKSIDCLITEPYLGPPVQLVNGNPTFAGRRVTEGKLIKILGELEKLYSESLVNWKKILKENGKVCIVFPLIRTLGKVFSMKNLIDSCEKLGYNVLAGPIEYGHPLAFIKRQIYLLELK